MAGHGAEPHNPPHRGLGRSPINITIWLHLFKKVDKENTMKKILSLLICAAVLLGALTCFSSCDTSPEVIRYGDFSLSENQFIYELAMEKTAYLSNNNITTDQSTIWSAMTPSGVSVDTACMNGLLRSEVLKMYFAAYAQNQGYGVTYEEERLIDENMKSLVSNFKDRESFNGYMANFNVGYDEIRALMRLQYLSQKGQALLFGEGKELEITDGDATAYFHDNYATVKHVFINNVNKTYPNQKVVPLTAEEKAEKDALIARLEQELTSSNFDEYLKQSEDYFSQENAREITLCRGTQSQSYEAALFGASVGQVVKVQCDNGVYFILRQDLDESKFTEEEKKAILTLLTENEMTKLYEAARKDAVFNQEILNLYTFAKAKYFTTFDAQ
jgi:hypothetical protein